MNSILVIDGNEEKIFAENIYTFGPFLNMIESLTQLLVEESVEEIKSFIWTYSHSNVSAHIIRFTSHQINSL